VYGTGGAIGAAASLTFAREGATLSLVGRVAPRLEAVEATVRPVEGDSHHEAVDAGDPAAADEHADAAARLAGTMVAMPAGFEVS
jgi:NAD(P)-dependent dehydrogenase (short-subunit alcohol dehydrogenase family)